MMKYCMTMLLLFVLVQSQAQEDFNADKKNFSIGLNGDYSRFSGNNFIAKSINPKIGFSFDLRGRLYKNWGIDAGVNANQTTLKTIEYIGNSENPSVTEWFGSIFYNLRINDRWLFVPKIGVSSFEMTSQFYNGDALGPYKYHAWGTAYFVAPEINYFMLRWLSASANLQYNYIPLNNIHANENAIGTSYQRTNEFRATVGLRFWF